MQNSIFALAFRSNLSTRLLKSTVKIGVALVISSASAWAAPLHIMIDPGHGGTDTGAARGPLRESEIALKVALRLADLLRGDERFKVSMTRTTDKQIALHARTQMAREVGADLFVSIHINSSTDPRARGKEFYFQNQLPADEEALFIASRENHDHQEVSHEFGGDSDVSKKSDLKSILEDLKRSHRIVASSDLSRVLYENLSQTDRYRSGSRAIRQAPFYVVSNIDIPSVLVELGFITNPIEGPKLATSGYQDELARGLYTGLARFKESVDKARSQPLKSLSRAP